MDATFSKAERHGMSHRFSNTKAQRDSIAKGVANKSISRMTPEDLDFTVALCQLECLPELTRELERAISEFLSERE
jgi:hypothetical protein